MNHNQYIGPIMTDFSGLELTDEDREILSHPLIGGVILFARNYDNSAQLQQLITEIRQLKPQMLIAVDHEGGRVQRFRQGFTQLPACAQFGEWYRTNPVKAKAQARQFGQIMAQELLRFDIDFSLAPVLDLNYAISEVIGSRSFSADPATVVELAGAYIGGMHSAGMAATGKHFPGHGAVKVDSHVDLPVDQRNFSEIQQADLIPFAKLSQQLDAIMPAHVVYPQVDKLPAGFSSYWLNDVLRDQLQFRGAVVSDDLSMQGAAIIGDMTARAKTAFAAGCDMVILANNRAGIASVLDNLKYHSPLASQKRLSKMMAKKIKQGMFS